MTKKLYVVSAKLTFLFLSSLFFSPICSNAQKKHDFRALEMDYEKFKETTIVHRRYKHETIINCIEKLKVNDAFEVNLEGQSLVGRDIYQVKWGQGDIKVLMWTQMHGNEPTATMALMDFFNYLLDEDYDRAFKTELASKVSLHMLPLLNPDGAERYSRFTALGIDMNRDALDLTHPESQILKRVREETNADWGFNLHDQSIYYTAGMSDKSARFSFLAPAFNYPKDINEKREDAMQLISDMDAYLQSKIPGHIAKYNDSFEPRAFGDNIQKWGTRTILIESGGTLDDPEKQGNRKLHFVLYKMALQSIINKDYEKYNVDDYDAIPYNSRRAFNLLLEGVQDRRNGKLVSVDIGIKRTEVNVNDATDFYYRNFIDDIGDLSTKTAYIKFDASGFETDSRVNSIDLSSWEDMSDEQTRLKYIKEGFAIFRVPELPKKELIKNWPVRFVLADQRYNLDSIRRGGNPMIYFKKDGERKYFLSNGILTKLD